MSFSCVKVISKEFTLFCRKFGNVANHAFLVLISRSKILLVLLFSLFATMYKIPSFFYYLKTCHYSIIGTFSISIVVITVNVVIIVIVVIQCLHHQHHRWHQCYIKYHHQQGCHQDLKNLTESKITLKY